MTHRKEQLPEKICVVCNRPFSWRKKWQRDWPSVRYCSEKCRRSKTRATQRKTHPDEMLS
ncbi:DUF2256 domain-containing protein [Spongiibacter marinus]|uniref:DUF2256 domain-containing protein n=1 Tax=Spongiibacter marinus TaxID=354246 RepID=UPI000A02CDF5|nr:DUF2256 domain-containing protein [Spongiibacter marinus]